MIDTVLAAAVVLLPTLFAVGIEVASKEIKQHPYWRVGVLLFGVGLSGLTWVQMSRATKAAAKDREAAILETSQRVSTDVSKSVTQAVTGQYASLISSLNQQIGTLEQKLAAQGKDVATIKGSNIVSGKGPVKVEVINPPSRQQEPNTPPLPGVNWTQEPKKADSGHHPQVGVQFAADAILDVPAFVAICDRPCKAIDGGCIGMSQVAGLLNVPNDPTVGGIVFGIPRPLAAHTQCAMTLESGNDKPVRVVELRVLRSSELPMSLR